MSQRPSDAGRLLWELERGGDREEIFRRLHLRFVGRVAAYFRHRHFSAEECEDLSQQTFIRAFRSISGFRGRSSFKTWLYEIARNVASNQIRDQRADKRDGDVISLEDGGRDDSEGGEVPVISGGRDPLEKLLHDEEAQLVKDEVANLPPRMRQCFKLYCEGFKFREIADVLHISTNAVKSHIGEAKKRIRNALADYRGKDNR